MTRKQSPRDSLRLLKSKAAQEGEDLLVQLREDDELLLTREIRIKAPISWEKLWIDGNELLRREVEWLILTERVDLLSRYGEITHAEARKWVTQFQLYWVERSSNDYEMLRLRRIMQLQELQNAAWREYRGFAGTKEALPALNAILKIIAEMGRFEGSYAPAKAQIATSHLGVHVNVSAVEDTVRELIRNEPDERVRRKLLEVEKKLLLGGPEIIEAGAESAFRNISR